MIIQNEGTYFNNRQAIIVCYISINHYIIWAARHLGYFKKGFKGAYTCALGYVCVWGGGGGEGREEDAF